MEEGPLVVCAASTIIWPSWAQLMLFLQHIYRAGSLSIGIQKLIITGWCGGIKCQSCSTDSQWNSTQIDILEVSFEPLQVHVRSMLLLLRSHRI